jgi:hypothetical protein
MARLGAVASLLALGGLLAGCGLATLMHDSILGPVSPAGRIHDAAVGRGFEATHQGVSADAEGEARLRPFPRDLIRRLGSPSSLQSLTTGLEAFLLGASTFADRRTITGATPDPSRIPTVGASVEEVVAALGPPDRWVHFAGGETMAYRSERERWTTLNIGVPPALGFLIPFPGASNLAYRRITKDKRSAGFVLFFDERRRLQRVASAPSP